MGICEHPHADTRICYQHGICALPVDFKGNVRMISYRFSYFSVFWGMILTLHGIFFNCYLHDTHSIPYAVSVCTLQFQNHFHISAWVVNSYQVASCYILTLKSPYNKLTTPFSELQFCLLFVHPVMWTSICFWFLLDRELCFWRKSILLLKRVFKHVLKTGLTYSQFTWDRGLFQAHWPVTSRNGGEWA